MKSLLQDIDLGIITSKFRINNNTIEIQYKTGPVSDPSEHIWLSEIVLSNHIKLNNSIRCYEYGVGYVSTVLRAMGKDVQDGECDNIIFTDSSLFNIDLLNNWNKKGKIIVAVDGVIDASIIGPVSKLKLHYNIYPIASDVMASDGTKTNYEINVIEIKNVNYDCIHRSEKPIRQEECPSCNNSTIVLDIYQCSIHGDCVIGGTKYTSCILCQDRKAL